MTSEEEVREELQRLFPGDNISDKVNEWRLLIKDGLPIAASNQLRKWRIEADRQTEHKQIAIEHDKKAEANKAAIKAAAVERMQALIDKHIKTLAIKCEQNISPDDYGNIIFDKWTKEQNYFIDNVLLRDELINNYLIDTNIESFRALGLEDIADRLVVEQYMRLIEIKKMINSTIKYYSIEKNEHNDDISFDINMIDQINNYLEKECV